jgi:hypothetical protein
MITLLLSFLAAGVILYIIWVSDEVLNKYDDE